MSPIVSKEQMLRNRFLLLTTLLFVGLLVGCTTNTVPTTSQTPSQPLASTPNQLPTQKPASTSSELGAVKITLVDARNGKPLADQVFYLAKMVPVSITSTTNFIAELDTSSSPGDNSDTNGNVVFSLVPPGKYVLALSAPLRQSLPKDAKTGTELIVDVVAGQVLDLGKHSVFVEEPISP